MDRLYLHSPLALWHMLFWSVEACLVIPASCSQMLEIDMGAWGVLRRRKCYKRPSGSYVLSL